MALPGTGLGDTDTLRKVASMKKNEDLTEETVSRQSMRAGATTADCWAAALLLTAGLVLRFFYIWHFRIDSDEPQHLHVVWAWANGMLPYRDVFDNHAPVFQALCAPPFHLLGCGQISSSR